jgi:hypothetical protein
MLTAILNARPDVILSNVPFLPQYTSATSRRIEQLVKQLSLTTVPT